MDLHAHLRMKYVEGKFLPPPPALDKAAIEKYLNKALQLDSAPFPRSQVLKDTYCVIGTASGTEWVCFAKKKQSSSM